jgi:hypothetical protein
VRHLSHELLSTLPDFPAKEGNAQHSGSRLRRCAWPVEPNDRKAFRVSQIYVFKAKHEFVEVILEIFVRSAALEDELRMR